MKNLPNFTKFLASFIFRRSYILLLLLITLNTSIQVSAQTNVGNALNFDGVDDYVVTSALVTNPTSLTLEAWFKTSVAKGGIVGFNQAAAQTNGSYDRLIYMTSDGKLNFGIWDGSGVRTSTSPLAYNDGKYHHVAASFAAGTNNGSRLYVDGELVASYNVGSNAVVAYNGYWKIGGFVDWASATGDYFNGTIDEVRIWNTVRTAAEIKDNRKQTIAPATTGLAYSYNFNQGVAGASNTGSTTINNQTAASNNGTLTNFALTGSTSNWVINYAIAPVVTYGNAKTFVKNTAITAILPTNTGGSVPATIYGQVTTFTGGTTSGNANGTGSAASFKNPYAIALDAAANLYVTDKGNFKLRKITPLGVVTDFAGSGTAGYLNSATASSAQFKDVTGITADIAGNIYVSDMADNRIRKISTAGAVTTFAGSGAAAYADGTGNAAQFNNPWGLASDIAGNIYVGDTYNNKIRKITPGGVVTSIAGSTNGSNDGISSSAQFLNPANVALDIAGNVYISDYGNQKIRKLGLNNYVTTLAGDGTSGSTDGLGVTAGPGNFASFNYPSGLNLDAAGNSYIADQNNNKIRKINSAGATTTLAGSGAAGSAEGVGLLATFNAPVGVALDFSGTLYVADASNNKIRTVATGGYTIAPALPAGLIFDGTTGTISGTPTTNLTATDFTITAYSPAGISTAVQNITVVPPPQLSYAGPKAYLINTAISPLTLTNSGSAVPAVAYGQVTTVAGGTATGSADGTGAAASFNSPNGITIDAAGNLFICDSYNNKIRKVTTAGVVTTFAGSGTSGSNDATGTAATFNIPAGITNDNSNNFFVTDLNNHKIRKITSSGVVTTLAGQVNNSIGSLDGTGSAASFYSPWGITIDGLGNLYVADLQNSKIRKITSSGVVTTFAGSGLTTGADGNGISASIRNPMGIAGDALKNMFVTEASNRIRKIAPNGDVTTIAGNSSFSYGSTDGTGSNASFSTPNGITSDAANNLYVADQYNNNIRKITPTGIVTTLAGSLATTPGSKDGTGTIAQFDSPKGILSDGLGNLYVSEATKIRAISLLGYSISPTLPAGLIFDGTTGTISGTPTVKTSPIEYTITGYNTIGSGSTILTIEVQAQQPAISYTSAKVYNRNSSITPLTPTNNGSPIPAVAYGQVTTLAGGSTKGSADGTGNAASFNNPEGITLDATGNLFVCDASNNKIRKITTAGVVTTFAGGSVSGSSDATGTSATFFVPSGITMDASSNFYVTDKGNNKIRKITSSGVVTTFAGQVNNSIGSVDGIGTAASFYSPGGLTIDGGNNLYVADQGNNKIRTISPTGVVATLAGNPTSGTVDANATKASFYNPSAVAFDASKNIFVADASNSLIRKINPNGDVTTVAGKAGVSGSTDGTGTNAQFFSPYGLVLDAANMVYVLDRGNRNIRKITPTGIVTTLAGSTGGQTGLTDGIGTSARFTILGGIVSDGLGNLFVSDQTAIRAISLVGYSISPALPAGLVFDGTTGTISGTPTALSPATDYTITGYNTAGSSSAIQNIQVSDAPLPLTWGTFTVQQQNATALLSWFTYREQNTKNFTIEHSSDGTFFKNVGTVAAAGNSQLRSNYSFIHLTPVDGINYYRLLQADIDGKASYSKVVNIAFNTNNTAFSILQNPIINNQLQVKLQKTTAINIYNNQGQLILTKIIAAGIQTINLPILAKGVYHIQAGAEVRKFIL